MLCWSSAELVGQSVHESQVVHIVSDVPINVCVWGGGGVPKVVV